MKKKQQRYTILSYQFLLLKTVSPREKSSLTHNLLLFFQLMFRFSRFVKNATQFQRRIHLKVAIIPRKSTPQSLLSFNENSKHIQILFSIKWLCIMQNMVEIFKTFLDPSSNLIHPPLIEFFTSRDSV